MQETVQGLCGLAEIILEPFHVVCLLTSSPLLPHEGIASTCSALHWGKLGLIHFHALDVHFGVHGSISGYTTSF